MFDVTMTALSQCPVSLSRSRDSCEEIDHRVPNICHVVFTPEQRASSLSFSRHRISYFCFLPAHFFMSGRPPVKLSSVVLRGKKSHVMRCSEISISSQTPKQRTSQRRLWVGGRGCQAGSVPPPAPQPALHKQIANHLCQYGAAAVETVY